MDFMEGMMGSGSGYGAAVDTLRITDSSTAGDRVGNAEAAERPARVLTEERPPTTPERGAVPLRPSEPGPSPYYIPPEYIPPNGGGTGGAGETEAPATGTIPSGGGDGGAVMPEGEVSGAPSEGPVIGPEVNGAPEKKRNTGLIVGGLLLVGVAVGGLGYAVYKASR